MELRIQDELDSILSPQGSSDTRLVALQNLEQLLALSLYNEDPSDLHLLKALQYTFECNIPSRLLPWLSFAAVKLEGCTKRSGSTDDILKKDITQLSCQITIALSLVQGITMIHPATKSFLGRKATLQIFIDLLLASRHVIISTQESPSKEQKQPQSQLTSVVLESLLCILVDSPSNIRKFEDCNGLQAVVKILKRAGTPRDVRMKSLEFLYFYLLDEREPSSLLKHPEKTASVSTAPATPIRDPPKKLFLSSRQPVSRQSHSFPSGSPKKISPASSSRSSSNSSSANSFSSTSSNASSSTLASTRPSTPSSPKKSSQLQFPLEEPPTNIRASGLFSKYLQAKSLAMLKDMDFVPESPQRVLQEDFTPFEKTGKPASQLGQDQAEDIVSGPQIDAKLNQGKVVNGNTRTTEEKKKILGTMLGNVDALVESVTKAGIWGLG